MSSEIKNVSAGKILDSRGSFTVEVGIEGKNGLRAVTKVPNSTSTGAHEVIAYPDLNVDKAVSEFNKIRDVFAGQDASDQEHIDALLREVGGKELEKFGGNIAVGVSISAAKLAAQSESMELYEYVNSRLMKKSGIRKGIPRPLGNLIGGGSHTKSAKMAIQEMLISPDSGSFMNNCYINAQTHKALGDHLCKTFRNTPFGINVEGAWNTGLNEKDNIAAAEAVMKQSGSKFDTTINLGMDFAASEYFSNGIYTYSDRKANREQQIGIVSGMIDDHGLVFAEDPMHEEDFDGFAAILKKTGGKSLITGDDLYTTNIKRLEMGIKAKATNAILIKVNQIGTLTDTINVVKLAHKNKMQNVVSHRSKETTDDFIAHLAVAFGSTFIKTGIVGGERIAKLNELSRIEEIERS